MFNKKLVDLQKKLTRRNVNVTMTIEPSEALKINTLTRPSRENFGKTLPVPMIMVAANDLGN